MVSAVKFKLYFLRYGTMFVIQRGVWVGFDSVLLNMRTSNLTSLSGFGFSAASIRLSRSAKNCESFCACVLLSATSALILTWVLVSQRAIFSMNTRSTMWCLNLATRNKSLTSNRINTLRISFPMFAEKRHINTKKLHTKLAHKGSLEGIHWPKSEEMCVSTTSDPLITPDLEATLSYRHTLWPLTINENFWPSCRLHCAGLLYALFTA